MYFLYLNLSDKPRCPQLSPLFELDNEFEVINKSSLPLTDPRHAVPHAHRAVHI